MSNFVKSEFSKTEHAQKTPVRIANEGQCTGAVRISTAMKKIGQVKHCYFLQVILGQYLSVRTRFEA